MASLARVVILVCLGLPAIAASAQPRGEAGEPTPEALDAAFTPEDAVRVAAGFSGEVTGGAPADPLGNMTEAADLVFRGTVVSQSYEYNARGTPYTRTIFSIAETLKGEHPANQFTLVQPGGPSSTDGERIMMLSDAQYFNVGEEELLFMNLDLQTQVEARRATVLSRFRVFRDQVFNEQGYGVTVEPLSQGAYRLALSNRPSDEQRFRRIHIGSHRLDKRFTGEQDPGLDRGARAGQPRGDIDDPLVDGVDGVDVETFSELIRR